jgi:hypothetical protein
LKNSQLTCGERHAYFGDRTLVRPRLRPARFKSIAVKFLLDY